MLVMNFGFTYHLFQRTSCNRVVFVFWPYQRSLLAERYDDVQLPVILEMLIRQVIMLLDAAYSSYID